MNYWNILLFYIIIFLGLVNKNSKSLVVVLFVFGSLLFGLSNSNADYNQYLNRYYGILTPPSEPLYSLLNNVSLKIGFSFIQFRWMIGTFSFIPIFLFSTLVKKNQVLVFIIYMSLSLIMYSTIFRFGVAAIFAQLGFYCLLKKKTFFFDFLTIFFFSCATMIHFSMIVLFVFLLIRIENKNKILLLTLVGCVGLFIFNIGGNVLNYFSNERFFSVFSENISRVLNAGNSNSVDNFVLIRFIIILFMSILINFFALKSDGENSVLFYEIQKINYISILLIPLIMINYDYYRMQFLLITINSLPMTEIFLDKKNLPTSTFSIKNIRNSLYLMIYLLVLTFLFFVKSNQFFESVYITFFTHIN